ncbi:TetR/AcrR family transcriptional regulator [Siminovitchia sp. 179-K 8D1 HS]|uniref:TetR/AcrR family transcriptional regulator n=1 Tax=Siminovitchia sp. 179-K 8D1 HS TaxID=3142385 RepID=UPI0039A3A53F
MSTQSTSERILDAAIQLISEKGYAAATTRSIAELAGVNEVTVFRHYGNKRGILKAIIDKFSYGPVLQKTIQFDITYELETDLLHFSNRYFQSMLPIKNLVLIAFKEAGTFPEIDEELANVPRFLKEQLMGYFREMKKRGKILDLNEEEVSLAFIALNFGHFISHIRSGPKVTELDIQDLLKTSMSIFSRGIAP